MTVNVGDKVIVRIPHRTPAVAMVAGKATGGDVIVRLFRGRSHLLPWHKVARRLPASAVARLASAREVLMGMPIHPLPAAAS